MSNPMKEKEKPKIKLIVVKGTPEWMLSFGDLMSCLLVFFVLLVTFSVPDDKKLLETLHSVQLAMGTIIPPIIGAPNINDDRSNPMGEMDIESGQAEKNMVKNENLSPVFLHSIKVTKRLHNFRDRMFEFGYKKNVFINEVNQGITIKVPLEFIYLPGSAAVRPRALPFLEDFANLAGSFSNEIRLIVCFYPDDPVKFNVLDIHLAEKRLVEVADILFNKFGISRSRISYNMKVVYREEDAGLELMMTEKLGTSEMDIKDVVKAIK